jgi:hypothetical protein
MKQNQNLRDQGQNSAQQTMLNIVDLQEDEHMIKPHPLLVIC